MTCVVGIERFSLTARDASGLAAFYQSGLGFRSRGERRYSRAECWALMGVASGASAIELELGGQIVELVAFDSPGRLYPADAYSNSAIFQHFAIIVADMREAYERLARAPGWSAITLAGPRRLPANTGGVSAFKFRDPEGHPLELLAFPADATPECWRARPSGDVCLGIDHSAIDVAETARSVAFYEALGFSATGASLNRGNEQQRLDNVAAPIVEVTTLSTPRPTPHLELLSYRTPENALRPEVRNNDVAATRVVLSLAPGPPETRTRESFILDPDGHRLTLVGADKTALRR
jgi:catechol 2,3-dioxygenase-like lactoylglutathione lyase family enzyme